MAFKLERPSPEGIHKLHRRLYDQWGGSIEVGRELQNLIHGRNVVEALREDEERNMAPVTFHTRRAGGIIEHATGLLMTPPGFSMEPRSLSPEDKLLAEQVERVAAALFEQQVLRTDFWASVARDVLSYARGFIKALPLSVVWTAQAGYPVRAEGQSPKQYLKAIRDWKASEAKFPFVIQHVPALGVLPLLTSDDQVMASVEEKFVLAKVLAEDLESSIVQGLLSAGEIDWYDRMPVIEYMDSNYIGYYLASRSPIVPTDTLWEPLTGPATYEELKVYEHGLGRCPMVMIPGIRTELPEYSGKFKSFLEDAKESLEVYDFLLSRLATMVWAYYLPSYIWRLGETAAATGGKERPDLEVNLGKVTTMYADETLEPLPYPTQLPDAERLLTELDDIIQRHTLEDVLFGRVAGSAPAYQVNLRINVARSKLTPLAQHMAAGITNVFELFLRGVEWLGEPVVIDGEEITPQMAKDARGRVEAKIEPKGPFDRNADMGVAKMALEMGFPWDWVVENIVDVEDPATLRLEKMVQDLEQTPPVQERLVREALDILDLSIEEEEFADAFGEFGEDEVPPELTEALRMIAEGAGEGLGRGPFPAGAAPQTIGGGRGLQTPKEQPQPGAVEIDSLLGL